MSRNARKCPKCRRGGIYPRGKVNGQPVYMCNNCSYREVGDPPRTSAVHPRPDEPWTRCWNRGEGEKPCTHYQFAPGTFGLGRCTCPESRFYRVKRLIQSGQPRRCGHKTSPEAQPAPEAQEARV